MDSFEFCLWLKGFFDLSSDASYLSREQIALIKSKLDVAVSPDPFVATSDHVSSITIGLAGEVSVSEEQT